MRNYLILVSLAKANHATGKRLVGNLQRITSEPVAPLWIDSAYVGIPIATDRDPLQIWESAVDGIDERADFRDMLIVELGRQWMARRDARATNWLMTHVGPPLSR